MDFFAWSMQVANGTATILFFLHSIYYGVKLIVDKGWVHRPSSNCFHERRHTGTTRPINIHP